ncbi:unnamed protein product [Candidula unifasciata]|uniref:Uncharacterized protein n=1 Tax=Candidula unifasciata TaxID=100452 RepID=A0A8S4A6M8_9EUPU|nr:unnamed protein product [Candidula unifasciata]
MEKTIYSRNVNCIKCAVVGDGMVGKTSMLYSYSRGVFNHKYTATVLETYTVSLRTGEDTILVKIYDTAGQNDFEKFRVDPYLESDVIILCFSETDMESFSNVIQVWMPEIKQHVNRKIPVILIGTKTDLRGRVKSVIKREDGLQMAKLIGAAAYVECSARNGVGLDILFTTIIECASRTNKRKNSFLNRLLKR